MATRIACEQALRAKKKKKKKKKERKEGKESLPASLRNLNTASNAKYWLVDDITKPWSPSLSQSKMTDRRDQVIR